MFAVYWGFFLWQKCLSFFKMELHSVTRGILIAQAGLKVEPQRVFLAYFVACPTEAFGRRTGCAVSFLDGMRFFF